MSARLPPAIFLMGPTAAGKTDLALALARALPCELISVDSALVYRDMDIGTAKITVEERQGIPHHMLDVLDVNQNSTVAWYQSGAREVIDEIQSK